jgi:hypothetical protein
MIIWNNNFKNDFWRVSVKNLSKILTFKLHQLKDFSTKKCRELKTNFKKGGSSFIIENYNSLNSTKRVKKFSVAV